MFEFTSREQRLYGVEFRTGFTSYGQCMKVDTIEISLGVDSARITYAHRTMLTRSILSCERTISHRSQFVHIDRIQSVILNHDDHCRRFGLWLW